MPTSNLIVQNLPRRFRALDDPARQSLMQGLASTLASLSTGTLVGHDLFFAWPGSNVQPRDVESMIKLVGYEKGWAEANHVWLTVDPRKPPAATAESVMKSFADLRHRIAHDVDAVPTSIEIIALTRNIKIASMLIDVLVSHGLRQLCAGMPTKRGFASSLKVRRIQKDGSKWPEYSHGSTKAVKRHTSLADAMAAASARSQAQSELLLAYDAGDLVDWRAPM